MTIKEAQARIKARVWQSVAQADLDLSALDKTTLESFVDLVTESALLEIEARARACRLRARAFGAALPAGKARTDRGDP